MAGFKLPLPNTPAREAMGDMQHLVEVLDPRNLNKLPDFKTALRSACAAFADDAAAGRPMIKQINMICLRANDERWLIGVGPRGGWRKLWNFGTGH